LPDARRYEFATRHSAGFAGLATAIDWLEEQGLDRIHARIVELSGLATEAVQASKHLAMTSPTAADARNGIVVIRLPAACKATAAYETLNQENGMLLSPVTHPQDIRMSVHFFNLPQEITAVIDRLDRYAAAAVAKA
jgi:selenocysteine lyase/cysteine desulfurase